MYNSDETTNEVEISEAISDVINEEDSDAFKRVILQTVDEEKSQEERDIVFDESKAYTKRFNPSINGDVSISFRINKKRVSHEFSLKILNVGMRTGMHFYEYNERTSIVEEKDGSGLIPNISYKIYF